MEQKTEEEMTRELDQAHRRYVAANEVWSRNLEAKFGYWAGAKRYTAEGRAVNGYEEFIAASDELCRLKLSKGE